MNCDTCIFEKRLENGKRAMICLQGHVRVRQIGGGNIENCHAWKAQPKCWCEQPTIEKRLQLHDYIVDQYGLGHYQMRSPENAKFCPKCGKNLIAYSEDK